jgi:TonB family protein
VGRLDQVASERAARAWPKCVVGSGLAHLVLVGTCLLIQPVSERALPILRVKLVEERSAPVSAPRAADVLRAPAPTKRSAPSPSKPRRASPKSVPPIPEAPADAVASVESTPASPPEPEAVPQPPMAPSPSHPVPATAPPPPAPAVPPLAQPAPSPLGPYGDSRPADALGSSAPGDQPLQASGGFGSPAPPRSTEADPRGAFLLFGHGDGVGAGNGSGTGPGGGLGRGSGAGWGGGDGAAGGHAGLPRGGNGAGTNGRNGDQLLRTIRRQIERVWTYPEAARRDGLEGRIELRFRIAADGSAETVEILRSSGHTLLDNDLAQTVRRAGPYPPYAGWVRLPFTYRLDR